jgi:preprotein translocase subunit YajC
MSEASTNPLVQFLPILIVFGIFYFLLIAPMRRRQKALAQLVQNLKKGDKVLTTGGLYGEVSALEDKVVHLRVADNVRVRVARSAISGIEGSEEAASR